MTFSEFFNLFDKREALVAKFNEWEHLDKATKYAAFTLHMGATPRVQEEHLKEAMEFLAHFEGYSVPFDCHREE